VPSRGVVDHLLDIRQGIERIDLFLSGLDFAQYCMDLKTRSAVERQLQIITEAAYRLGDEAETVCPGPDWKGYMGMGNILRHAYHRVGDDLVWNTITLELPPLRLAVDAALKRLSDAATGNQQR
jgi:uncharacterized protein with HEPN domain